MRKLIIGLGAAAALSVPSAAPAVADNPQPVDDCGDWWSGPGPHGWLTGHATCWNPGARNIMFRVRVDVVGKITGESRRLYGDWKDCAGVTSSRNFDGNAWHFINVTVGVAPDTLAGGC